GPLRQMDLLPPALLFGRGGLVPLALLERRLPPEPAVALEAIGVEAPRRQGVAHGASRLAGVAAVREAAGGRQRGDVVEGRVDGGAVDPRLDLTHPRRVDEQRPALQLDEL